MQKICLLAFSLLISFNISFAKSGLVFAEVLSPTPTPKVNYELPYPGLLPDSPIYFLRIIRDKTVGFLIADSLKKAEFNLLQADKRLNAGIYLFNKGKVSLALSTVSKAENYFEQAIGKAKGARLEGMEVNEVTRKLINSARKHQEELEALAKKSPANFQESFSLQSKRAEAFEKEAVTLTLK